MWKQGHWAATGPQGSASKGSSLKRPAPTGGMAQRQDDEHGMIIFEDHNGHQRPDCVMLDPGASAFLAGYGPFRRFLQYLKEDCHFPVETIKMTRGRRRFQFGGDTASWSTWSAHLPIFLDGRYGTVQLFLLPGQTPMLCGRPIIEAMGMTMDFAMQRVRFWQQSLEAGNPGQTRRVFALPHRRTLLH